jgi:hypothetical protein
VADILRFRTPSAAEVYTNLQSQDILQSAAKLNEVHNDQEDVHPGVHPKPEAVENA